MREPYTSVTLSIDNIDGCLDRLDEMIRFEVKPSCYSQLELFYDADSHEWRYLLYSNFEVRKNLCRGTLEEGQFELVFNEMQQYSDITTKDEVELGHILNSLTYLIQDDYTSKIMAESAMHQLVQEGLIRARTADSVIDALGSRGEY